MLGEDLFLGVTIWAEREDNRVDLLNTLAVKVLPCVRRGSKILLEKLEPYNDRTRQRDLKLHRKEASLSTECFVPLGIEAITTSISDSHNSNNAHSLASCCLKWTFTFFL